MTTKQRISDYRATIQCLKARIRHDKLRPETELSFNKCEYLKLRIVNDLVAIDNFESRIYWMARP